jgi:isopenicillin-N epimerase
MGLSRRQFLAGAGAGAVGVVTGTIGASGAGAMQGGPSPSSDQFWSDVRAEFDLDPDWIHLAGLLLASHPRPVREAIERHRRELDRNPAHYLYGGSGPAEGRVRASAARYLGARSEEIALTGSTTMGLAMVYNGLALRHGNEVVTTTHDHRVTHESLRYKAERSGASVRPVPLYREPSTTSAAEMVARLIAAVRPRTRVVALTWVHSSTGVKLPIRQMAQELERLNATREAAERVILCVDGVHGLGVEEFSVASLGCDFLIAGTHKWLFGPRGTGIVWGHPRAQSRTGPTIPSFTRDGTWGGEMTPGGFHSFEHRWALAEAFEFHLGIGQQRVARRIHALNVQLKEGLAAFSHVRLHTPRSQELSSGLVCFDVDGLSPAAVVSRLRERGIVASRTPYATSHARLTPGLLNSEEEVEFALGAVRDLRRG